MRARDVDAQAQRWQIVHPEILSEHILHNLGETLATSAVDFASDTMGVFHLAQKITANVVVMEGLGFRLVVKRFGKIARAKRAYRMAHRLTALQIHTPQALALFIGRKLRCAFVVTTYLDGYTLSHWRDFQLPQLRTTAEGLKRVWQVSRQVGGFIRRLHDAKVFHGDLHSNNLLFADGRIYLLDLDSMRRMYRRRAVSRNLVRLNRDFLNVRLLTQSDRLRFLRSYLGEPTKGDRKLKSLWRKLSRATVQKLATRGLHFTKV